MEGWGIHVYQPGVSAGADVFSVVAALGAVVGAGLCPFCAISAVCAHFNFTVFDAPNDVISGTAQPLQEV